MGRYFKRSKVNANPFTFHLSPILVRLQLFKVGSVAGDTSVSFTQEKLVAGALVLAILFVVLLISPTNAADITATLDDAAGSSVFNVKDSGSTEQAHIDSDGNGVLKGCLRVDASGAECTVTEGLVIDGNVGIGTTGPAALFSVGSTSQFQVNSSGIMTAPTPVLTGKYDLNDVAVDDDDCTGDQGKGWYDSTDSAWEFCNANSGAPTVLGGGGGSPTDATYITQTANGTLSAEQALSSLSSGIMRVATTTGVITSLTDSSGIASNISDETGTGVMVFGTAPTFTTSITDPLVIGGTGTTSTLALRSTSGVGTTGADIIFQTGNNGATEAMRILNSGNVGIATTGPGYKLDVSGDLNITGTYRVNGTGISSGIGGSGTTNYIPLFATATTLGNSAIYQSSGNIGIGTTSPQATVQANVSAGSDLSIYLSDGNVAHGMTTATPTDVFGALTSADSTAGGLQIIGRSDAAGGEGLKLYGDIGDANPTDTIPAVLIRGRKKSGTNTAALGSLETVFQVQNDTTNLLTILGGGNVGIGTTAPTQVLTVNGRISMATWTADGDTAAYRDTATDSLALVTSDRRLKKNIVPLTGSLDIVRQFNTYKYNDLDEQDGSKLKLGLMAQEVLPLLPELTYEFTMEGSKESYYGVHYDKLPVLLLGAVKELDSKVDSLSEQIGVSSIGTPTTNEVPPTPSLTKRGSGGVPTLASNPNGELVGTEARLPIPGDSGGQAIWISSSSSEPSTPAEGQAAIYMKSDGNLYLKSDQGKETPIGGSSLWTSTENGIFYAGGAVGIGLEEKLSGLTVRAAADKAINGTTAANNTTQIEGTGTRFLSELGIGDRISLSSSPSMYTTVTAIDSDTRLSVDGPLGGQGFSSNQTISKKSSIFRLEDAAQITQFIVNDSGSVGIGTLVPNAKLHVEGGIARISDGANQIDIGSAMTEISGAPYKLHAKDNDLSIYSAQNLALGSNNKEDTLYLNGRGMLGVGTSDPQAVLHVEGRQGPVTLEVNSSETRARNTVFLINSDVSGKDKGIFRVLADGSTFADGPYAGTGADYAEWFEKEGDLKPRDVAGLNMQTGRVRRYQPGDVLAGVISIDPLVIGNHLEEKSDEDMKEDFALVSLVGQVEIDPAQVQEKAGEVLTPDGHRIGYRLAGGRVLLRVER